MSKNKIFLSLTTVAAVIVVFLVFSIDPETPTTAQRQIGLEVKAPSAIQEQQIEKPDAEQSEDAVAKISGQSHRPSALDADIKSLTDEVLEDASESANFMLNNPIHPGRAKLQEQMRNETFEKTFHNLVDNDNFATLMPAMGGHPFSPGAYESDVVIVSKMTRVRKLLEDARENPDEVSAFLQEQLRELVDDYPQQYAKFLKELNEAGPDGLHTKQLSEHSKTRLLCTSAVYVLSQIRAGDALPTLAWLSTQGERGKTISQPVNPKFLFYAMHNIIQRSSGASLSGNFYEYLEKAKAMNIPDAKPTRVTTWNAHFHEDDFRGMLRGKKIDLDTQPTIELERFPSLDNLSTQKAESLLAQLRDFVG